MKVVILAGGYGTRLAEETAVRPKPMVEIGGRPILWHIMQLYSAFGFEEFIIALGYKGEVIKEYFLNFFALNNDLTVDLSNGNTTIHDGKQARWRVHLVDTGRDTQTGGRLLRLKDWLTDGTFMMTYGDGLADVDLRKLVRFHQDHGDLATVTTVRPPARFGGVIFDGDRVSSFSEKPQSEVGWINGGFFVLQPGVLDYVSGDEAIWERAPLESLAGAEELHGYRHTGFWQPMDTLREKRLLEGHWRSGQAPWKIWDSLEGD